MVLEIKLGNIINEKVDCIINSTNAELEWEETTLNGDILNGAGELLIARFKELHDYFGDLKVGHFFITPSFKLPSENIVHAYFPHWEGGLYDEETILYNTLNNIFTYLSLVKPKIKSIAIPPICTGVFMFPKEIVFNIILNMCEAYKYTFDKFVLISNNEQDIKLINEIWKKKKFA